MSRLEFLEGYTPADFGLDLNEYPRFRTDPLNDREVQLEAIEFMVYCEKWVAAGRIPTGVGKMLIAYCVHKITGLRTAALTSTKGLQDQYKGKLEKYGACDIRGRSNYDCGQFNNLKCRGGASMGCRYTMGNGCEYEMAKDNAKNEPFVVTNYKYWMTVNDKANGLERTGEDAEFNGRNPIELLILDEGHAAVSQLSDYIGFSLTENDVRPYCEPRSMGESWKDWKTMASDAHQELCDEIVTTQQELGHLGSRATQANVRVLHDLEEKLLKFERLIGLNPDDWVLQEQKGTRWGRQWDFDVIKPGQYARNYLFCGVPKVVIMSATLNKKDLGLLWLGQDDYEFREWRRIFPVQNCPIYYCPATYENDEGKQTAIKVVQSTTAEHKKAWVRHMDAMIESRLDRRIVLITSSYKYAEYLIEHSRFSQYMLFNKQGGEGGSAADKFEEFINTEPPVILCSPSFGTGWDFSFDRCEFLILTKVPLRVPGGASKVMAARLERDPEYGDNETMRDVVQICGRPQRDEKDTGEVVIADGSWGWFGYKNAHLAPTGFVKDVQKVAKLPPAPKSIKARKGK